MIRPLIVTALVLATAIASADSAEAEVRTRKVAYTHDGATLEGHLAWDDSVEGKRPGVLVVHEWWGLNDYARQRAEQLAEMGYVAFALDMYGKGQVTSHPSQAGEWAGMIRKNTDKWRARANAGLKVLLDQKQVDHDQVAAIGYCFGGSTVLQMAYADEPLKGVVSFHGALPTPSEEEAKAIDASILVCHGAEDAFVSEESIDSFRKALEAAGVDYQLVYYGGARHGFTNPEAGTFGIDNLKYDAAADRRSWAAMQDLFAEIFDEKK
ncbi:MAG: dienelactone hydrolase family protein [Maioricimonas sp. JB049]